jgi:tRNA(adenine34) deaminase
LHSPNKMISKPDEWWMEEALREAGRARAAGEVPVGAIVVSDGKIVGRGFNRPISSHDPTAHAEIVALREAARTVQNYRLENCELFVTIEPCAMCAGAIMHARIKRLIYGADDPKAGAVCSIIKIVNQERMNHRLEVTRGVLAARSMEAIQSFFREKRQIDTL